MAQRGSRGQDLHRRILELLLDKVRQDPYPSVTMMNLIEQQLEPDDVEEYVEILMEKIENDDFPSLDHLQRLQQFA